MSPQSYSFLQGTVNAYPAEPPHMDYPAQSLHLSARESIWQDGFSMTK